VSQPNLANNYSKKFFSKRKEDKQKFENWMTSTYIILLSLIVCLLLYYVWILNANATKWYNIRTLDREKRELLIEKELLDVKIAELESLSNILNDYDKENMEKVKDPNYLVIKENVQYVYKN
jgi:cell division septal protein FtsQ